MYYCFIYIYIYINNASLSLFEHVKLIVSYICMKERYLLKKTISNTCVSQCILKWMFWFFQTIERDSRVYLFQHVIISYIYIYTIYLYTIIHTNKVFKQHDCEVIYITIYIYNVFEYIKKKKSLFSFVNESVWSGLQAKYRRW